MANEDLPAACATSRIILGLHSVDTSQTMMSMRTFEILGSGGFYLTQWTAAIEKMFVNHQHLVWTRSREETLDLVNYYLSRPDLRKKIARQGQAEVYRRHTYQHRVSQILPYLQQLTPVAFAYPRPQPQPQPQIQPQPVFQHQVNAEPVSQPSAAPQPVRGTVRYGRKGVRINL